MTQIKSKYREWLTKEVPTLLSCHPLGLTAHEMAGLLECSVSSLYPILEKLEQDSVIKVLGFTRNSSSRPAVKWTVK